LYEPILLAPPVSKRWRCQQRRPHQQLRKKDLQFNTSRWQQKNWVFIFQLNFSRHFFLLDCSDKEQEHGGSYKGGVDDE
jgi:hypothetical protein